MDRPPALAWLLPAAFVIHDAEEFVTWKSWLTAHGNTLGEWLQRTVGTDPVAPLQAMSDASVLQAMCAIFGLLLAATAAFALRPGRLTLWIYLVVLGGFFVHGVAHLAQAVVVGGYTPGVVTAVLVVLPSSLLIYRSLMAGRPIPVPLLLASAMIGGLLVIPAILLALSIGQA